MGLWADLFKRASRGEAALLAPGRTFFGAPPTLFPDLGRALLVSSGAPLELEAFFRTGKPTLALVRGRR